MERSFFWMLHLFLYLRYLLLSQVFFIIPLGWSFFYFWDLYAWGPGSAAREVLFSHRGPFFIVQACFLYVQAFFLYQLAFFFVFLSCGAGDLSR